MEYPREESLQLSLGDLSDPRLRRVLYNYIERMLIRTSEPTSIINNEIHHLHQTILALETNIHIWNIGNEETYIEDSSLRIDPSLQDAENLVSITNTNVATVIGDDIPDAQPLDYDHPVFENQFMPNSLVRDMDDVDTVLDEELDSLPSLESPGNSILPLQRTYSIPLRHLPSHENTVSFNEYIQSIYRQPKKFIMKRYPISEIMLKHKNAKHCSVCLETPKNLQIAISQCCSNVFCVDCIKNWETSCSNKRFDSTCPLCRQVGPEFKVFSEHATHT